MPDDNAKKPPEEDDFSVTSFSKPVGEILDALPPPPEAETFKQKLSIWVLKCVFALIIGAAVPFSSYAVSCGLKTAEEKSALKKSETENKLRQRNLQLQLFKEITDVAKKADFKDPTALYRLGLLARMVNENYMVFGIQLIEAEKTMDTMFEKLTPIRGLRKRLAESDALIGDLLDKVKGAKATEKETTLKLKELQTSYKKDKRLSTWQRNRLKKKIDAKQEELTRQKTVRLFYVTRLFREKRLRRYFQRQLGQQAKMLQKALNDADSLRSHIKIKTARFKKLLGEIQSESSRSKQLIKKLRKELLDMERDHTKAEQTIKRLQTELKSEREEHKQAKAIIEFFKKQCVEKIQKDEPTSPKLKKKAVKKPQAAGGGVGLGGAGGFRSKPVRFKRKMVTNKKKFQKRPRLRPRPMSALKSLKKAAAKKTKRRYHRYPRRRIQGLDGVF